MFKNVMLAVAAFAFLTQINPILGDDVEDLLKKLDASVNDAIAKANATLEQTKAILNEFAQNIVRTGKSMIYDTLSQHKASLDTLKRMAKKT